MPATGMIDVRSGLTRTTRRGVGFPCQSDAGAGAIQIQRENVWQVYTEQIAKDGLLRGGANTASAKMFKSNNGEESVRPADFKIVFDPASGEHFVYPDGTKSLSFSSNLQRLRDIPIPGRVWLLPRRTELPEGLVINYGRCQGSCRVK